MSDINTVIIEGYITKNSELRYAGTAPVVAFSIANNRSYKNQNGEYTSVASFFDCELWGKYGESMQKHLTKGRHLTVKGELKQDTWTDGNGNRQSRIKIRVEDLSLIWDKKNQQQQPQTQQPEQTEENPFDVV